MGSADLFPMDTIFQGSGVKTYNLTINTIKDSIFLAEQVEKHTVLAGQGGGGAKALECRIGREIG